MSKKTEQAVVKARWEDAGYQAESYVDRRTDKVLGGVKGNYSDWSAWLTNDNHQGTPLGEYYSEEAAKRAVVKAYIDRLAKATKKGRK